MSRQDRGRGGTRPGSCDGRKDVAYPRLSQVATYRRCAILEAMAALMRPAAEILRDARDRAGLSQTELGRRAGVAQSVISMYEAGKRQPALETLAALIDAAGYDMDVELLSPDQRLRGLSGPVGRRVRRVRQQLLQAAIAVGATNVRVFGSVARGEDRPDSDVDLLVDIPQGTSLLDLIGLQQEMEDMLHVHVDLVPEAWLKPWVRENAMKDVMPL